MTTTHQSLGLVDAVDHPHERALAALDDPTTSSLTAVAWAATHLAAVERVLYPAAARALPSGDRRVRAQRGCDRRLHRALWRLDRRLTGDANIADEPVGELEDEVRAGLRQHSDGERALVAELERTLDDDAQRELAADLDEIVRLAPTRPHPDTPHTRLTGGLLFRLDAMADRFRDLMDGREVPTPRRSRPPRIPGRWGSYLMGLPYPPRARYAATDSTTEG